jgi:histidinol phosphatase-like PHP family hydrolase/calcineurin-like phosphoesterase family protein
MNTKIIIITDLHYVVEGSATLPERRGDYGDILLLRAVHRINRFLKPDLVILGGDLIDDRTPGALKVVKKITDLLTMPVLLIPGNHDCFPEEFFDIYPKNPDYLDINGCRFIPFYDREIPECNAERSQDDLKRMRTLAEDFSGPVISCQHVPLFQPESLACPYNLTNAEEVVAAMKEYGVTVAISGHYHSGFFNSNQPFGTSVCVPALAEKPFKFWELNIDEESGITHIEHQLAMPEELELFDVHVHSNFAYCSENMDFQKSIELADMFNLNKLAFSEHSGQLYFSAEDYWGNKAFQKEDLTAAYDAPNRFDSFIKEVTPYKSDHCCVGLEFDCNYKGEPIVNEKHLQYADIRLGAIHCLPEGLNVDEVAVCFKKLMEKFTEFPMDIIAHPFRIFRRSNLEVPDDLYPFMVKLLKKRNLAAEINFHTNYPSEKFFSMCLEEGVKIALGSDSHNLYEVGEFFPHLDFLKRIGGYPNGVNNVELFR